MWIWEHFHLLYDKNKCSNSIMLCVLLNISYSDSFRINSGSEEGGLPSINIFLTLTGQLQLTVVLIYIPVDIQWQQNKRLDVLSHAFTHFEGLILNCVFILTPLFSVEEGEDMLAGHEAFLHIAQLQVVHLQHVLLLFLLQRAIEKHPGYTVQMRENRRHWLRRWGIWFKHNDGQWDLQS